ncbi:MED14-domain-containing protein [Annulohypoxylon truncatum]|uniref:MED14-domain-containing protein n=1 Tax=Annulohypoxylon truncatum TaxID=327061 RepID=UPI002008AAE9|nr:MED14-domain-containing protein [Annulohypoxylon truncatum]KAI1213794.1 MED14-domain-containing protein [Annulohypoxylon truncatum]
MMPGVVMMENGVRAPLATNHDRDHGQFVNGNGNLAPHSNGSLAGAGAGGSNGVNNMANGDEGVEGAIVAQSQNASRMNDLPDEIKHITQGFVPLGDLLARLAQKTHNQLVDEIVALAKMPVSTPAMNGNSGHVSGAVDDNSPENINKKVRLLNFAQERHTEWVKATVIARWSRNAHNVSKLIDLFNLYREQQMRYNNTVGLLAATKTSLAHARLPNPDLRTALHVLSTGTAPWMPDLNYLDVPPLSSKDKLQWIENLNTLLSIRLNLEDYDNIPYHFQNYTIHSGRVTFKVPGEFEVDLTIADEDFDKQFWFIDFRFDFTPAPTELSDVLRMRLESKVNEVLEKDGLHGCYKFLHELVLTQKITEYVRQAFEMSKGRWVDMLKVERLNRAMSIQYWVGRYQPEGPKSWIILGVNSGKKGNGLESPDSSSYLTLRWFRDNREVKEFDIPFDDANISTEDLLLRAISKHVEYILTSIHSKLKPNGRFTKREAGLILDVPTDPSTQPTLKMQLSHSHYVTVGINPTSGMFSMKPQSPLTWKAEHKLNYGSKDPIQDSVPYLETLRCHHVVEEIIRRGKSAGWGVCKGPVKPEIVKGVLTGRETGQFIWLRRRGWPDQWHLMVNLSLSGDKWYLMEVNSHPNGEGRIASHTKLLLSSSAPNLEDRFFSNLTTFTAAMISHLTDLKALHKRRIKQVSHIGVNYALPANMKVPSIFIKLSDILRQPQSDQPEKRVARWAHDFVEITFRGMRTLSTHPHIPSGEKTDANETEGSTEQPKELLRAFLDARLKVSDPDRFGLLKGHVERDVAFNKAIGVFALRLEANVGSSILDTLTNRLKAIDKLADCIDAIRRSDRDIQCEEITLNKVVITYTDRQKSDGGATIQPRGDRWKATLELGREKIELKLGQGNPQLRALDHFRHLINSHLRCGKLPFYLSSTLPIHRALDSVEDAWEDLAMNNRGRVEIFAPHLDWFNIRYHLPGLNRTPQVSRRLTLQVRLQNRREGVEWEITRVEPGRTPKPDDEFKQVLDKVYNADGKAWRSLGDSASSKMDHRVGELIKAVDEAVRRLAMQSPTVVKQNQPRTQVQPRSQAQAVYHKAMAASRARPQAGQVVVLDD